MDQFGFGAFLKGMADLLVGLIVLVMVLASIALFLALALGVTYWC